MRRVGLIGLGAMGTPMAERLREAGLLSGVYNRTRGKAAALESKGVYVAASPSDLAGKCDVIISIVSDDVALRSVMLGPGGALETFAAGGIVIEMSTTSVEVLMEVAEEARKRGVELLDAPVSGIPSDAERGDLTVLVGGSQEALERCKDVLKPLATAILPVGEVGAGRHVKYANNMLVAVNLMAALEATAFVMKTNVDPKKFVEAIKQSRGNSWAFSRFIPALVSSRSEEHKFTLTKDLDLALAAAAETGASTPFTALARQYLRKSSPPKGRPKARTVTLSSLAEVFERASDVKFSKANAKKGRAGRQKARR